MPVEYIISCKVMLSPAVHFVTFWATTHFFIAHLEADLDFDRGRVWDLVQHGNLSKQRQQAPLTSARHWKGERDKLKDLSINRKWAIGNAIESPSPPSGAKRSTGLTHFCGYCCRNQIILSFIFPQMKNGQSIVGRGISKAALSQSLPPLSLPANCLARKMADY